MAKTKRKLFLGEKPIGGSELKSRKLARKITSKYHKIQQFKTNVQKDVSLSKQEKEEKLTSLAKELDEMGGVDKYQQASVISTSHFQTSKWIIKALRKHNFITESNKRDNRIKTLEIGAINDQLFTSEYLDVKAIDLHSRLPFVEERDFFTLEPQFLYRAVVCSMVINCVFDSSLRGEMIARLFSQLSYGGILFLILPKTCILSPYIETSESFEQLLLVFGFQLLERHTTPRLEFYVLTHNPKYSNIIQDTTISWENKTKSILRKNYSSNLEVFSKYSSMKKITNLNPKEFRITIPNRWLPEV